MDTQFLGSLVDQAIGGVIALILLTKIDKRLEQLSTDVQALITEIRAELKKSA
ncbi:YvrJ family protein [Lacticaseibacillus sp. GG6-2]